MIRIAIPEDVDFVYSLYMHPDVNPFLMYELMSEKEFEPVFQDLLDKKLKFIYIEDEISIGMFKLIPNTYRSSHIAYLGGLAIHPDHEGRGHGKKMIRELIEFAGNLGFLRIELSVAFNNIKAISLYEKTGFSREGILRKYTFLKKDNKFIDEILMSYLL